jgi:hypothetical protein
VRRPLPHPPLFLLLLLVGLLSIPAAAIAVHFTDVPADSPHKPGIDYLEETGITLGCTDTEFCPSDTLRRDQMGTFLYRSSGNDPATPPSVNAASIAEIVMVEDDNAIAGSAVNNASASCPEGTTVTGGGGSTTGAGTWRLAASRPLAGGTGWTVQYVEKDGNLAVGTATAWAMCVAVGTP